MEELSTVTSGCETYPLRSSRCRSSSIVFVGDDIDDKRDEAEKDETILLVEVASGITVGCSVDSEI